MEGVGDRVVVVGGWELLCPPTADCPFPEEPMLADGAVLDTRTDEWSPMVAAPFGLMGDQRRTVALGGSLFTVTGCRAGTGCAGPPELLEYDVAADRWHEHGRLPGVRTSYLALVPVGDRIVVHRGSDEEGRSPDLVFHPGSGGCSTRMPAAGPRDRRWTATAASTSTASWTVTTRRTSSPRSGRSGARGGRDHTTSTRVGT